MFRSVVSIELPPQQLREAMAGQIGPDRLPGVWRPGLPSKFIGEVGPGQFRVRRIGPLANAFRPIVCGQIIPTVAQAGTRPASRVEFTARLARPTQIFTAIWLSLLSALTIALVIQEARAGRPLWLSVLIPAGLAAAILSFCRWQVRSGARSFEDFARSLASQPPERG